MNYDTLIPKIRETTTRKKKSISLYQFFYTNFLIVLYTIPIKNNTTFTESWRIVMGKIILFYKYIDIRNLNVLQMAEKKSVPNLDYGGRVLIAREGINGTLGGSTESIDRYKAIMYADPSFSDVDFKDNEGSEHDFPRLA